jgi:hypothetical protein
MFAGSSFRRLRDVRQVLPRIRDSRLWLYLGRLLVPPGAYGIESVGLWGKALNSSGFRSFRVFRFIVLLQ